MVPFASVLQSVEVLCSQSYTHSHIKVYWNMLMSLPISSTLMWSEKGLKNVSYFQNTFKGLCAGNKKNVLDVWVIRKVGNAYQTCPTGVI